MYMFDMCVYFYVCKKYIHVSVFKCVNLYISTCTYFIHT